MTCNPIAYPRTHICVCCVCLQMSVHVCRYPHPLTHAHTTCVFVHACGVRMCCIETVSLAPQPRWFNVLNYYSDTPRIDHLVMKEFAPNSLCTSMILACSSMDTPPIDHLVMSSSKVISWLQRYTPDHLVMRELPPRRSAHELSHDGWCICITTMQYRW